MKPTRLLELLAVFVVTAIGCALIAASSYDRLPRFQLSAPIGVLLVAAFAGYTAVTTRARLDGRPGTKPIVPLLVARYAALAKASSLGGAVAGGAWAGIAGYAATQRDNFRYAEQDALLGALGVVAALALVVAALRLERACRVRNPPEHRDDLQA